MSRAKAYQLYDAWNRDDLDAVLDLISGEVRVDYRGGAFPGLEKTYEGHDGIRRYWSDLRDPWEEITMSAVELHGDNDTIVTVFEFQARGRDGIEVRRELGNVLRFRDGSVINLEAHDDPTAAFRSAGITE